jgi:hypothetical protein
LPIVKAQGALLSAFGRPLKTLTMTFDRFAKTPAKRSIIDEAAGDGTPTATRLRDSHAFTAFFVVLE